MTSAIPPHAHIPSTERSSQPRIIPAVAHVVPRHLGGWHSGGASDSVLAVLRDPPKKVPRSPTLVMATLSERSRLEPEDEVPSVEVRWRVPSQASLAPTVCGDVERFYVKVWCRGKGKEVIRTKTSTVNVPRRDFCRNQVKQECYVWQARASWKMSDPSGHAIFVINRYPSTMNRSAVQSRLNILRFWVILGFEPDHRQRYRSSQEPLPSSVADDISSHPRPPGGGDILVHGVLRCRTGRRAATCTSTSISAFANCQGSLVGFRGCGLLVDSPSNARLGYSGVRRFLFITMIWSSVCSIFGVIRRAFSGRKRSCRRVRLHPLDPAHRSTFQLQSPPSCMSKPLLIPESKEDHQWRLGGLLQRVNGKEMPSPSAVGEGVAQTQVGWNFRFLVMLSLKNTRSLGLQNASSRPDLNRKSPASEWSIRRYVTVW